MSPEDEAVRNLFSSDLGARVLEGWVRQHVTRTAPVDAPEAELRVMDARRAFVMDIMHLLTVEEK